MLFLQIKLTKSMYFIADIGNSYTKASVFKHGILQKVEIFKNSERSITPNKTGLFPNNLSSCSAAVISSVKKEIPAVIREFCANVPYVLQLKSTTPIPLTNNYRGKETLGADRIAAAVGANNIFPNTNVLVIDAGTALTIDFVSAENAYEGGIISPGIQMRFKALHEFTAVLPQEKTNAGDNNLRGKTTSESIRYGVQNSILYEVREYLRIYQSKYPDLKTVFTGGDIFFFENTLKKKIFAEPNLVLYGLNGILQYNYDQAN